MVGTRTKFSSIKPGYLKTVVVVIGHKDRRLLRLLILLFVYYFVVWTVFYYPKVLNMIHALSISVLIAFKGSNFYSLSSPVPEAHKVSL